MEHEQFYYHAKPWNMNNSITMLDHGTWTILLPCQTMEHEQFYYHARPWNMNNSITMLDHGLEIITILVHMN